MVLSTSEQKLWDKLQQFSLDDDSASFSFTDRLARENNWRLAYACRVVQEYKRFLFLAVTSGQEVTPSDQVDQAWHLHMVYTRSYWDVLCGEVLETPIHHGPTRGGPQQRVKFIEQYE